MSRRLQYVLSFLVAAFVVGAPIAHVWHRKSHLRNLRVVRPGVLYRSGQLSRQGLKRVIHDLGIKTVVTLRDSYDPAMPPPDLAEEQYCRAQELNYVRITPRPWWAADGSVPAEQGVRQFWKVMDDPANYPVLIHCFAGVHRTGAYCAIYRMEYEGWSNAAAMAEMRRCGYDADDEWDILGYLEAYQPRRRRAYLPAAKPR